MGSQREYRMQQLLHISYKWARRVAVAILGGTVLAVGVAMIVLPGPSVVVIPVGLAILSLEFAWARRWLDKVKGAREHVTKRFQASRKFSGSGCDARAPERGGMAGERRHDV